MPSEWQARTSEAAIFALARQQRANLPKDCPDALLSPTLFS
jgi:hypothetical protein